MGMVVTHLVFASTSCADCETLHDRRKVMVSIRPARPLRPDMKGNLKLQHLQCLPAELASVEKCCLQIQLVSGLQSMSGCAGDARVLC